MQHVTRVREASFGGQSLPELGPTGFRRDKGCEEAPGFALRCSLVPVKGGPLQMGGKEGGEKGRE